MQHDAASYAAVFPSDGDPNLDNYAKGRKKKRHVGTGFQQQPTSSGSTLSDCPMVPQPKAEEGAQAVNGIYVGKGPGSNIAGNLHVSSPDTCVMTTMDHESEKPKESKANMHFNEQGDLVADDGNERSTSFQQELDRQQAELAKMMAKLEAAQEITAKLEAAHLDNSKSIQGSS
ncbi:hypothetical protein E4U25_005016 [Claviceps purpurea]|nr:hypothetical protein E4U25_005016 [Claviceps purpurea]